MRSLMIIALTLTTAVASPALAANAGSDKMKMCAANWNAMTADQKKSTTYKQYTSDCMSGKTSMMGPMGGMEMDKSKMSSSERMKACAAEWKAMPADQKKGTTYKAFSSQCLKK